MLDYNDNVGCDGTEMLCKKCDYADNENDKEECGKNFNKEIIKLKTNVYTKRVSMSVEDVTAPPRIQARDETTDTELKSKSLILYFWFKGEN